MFHRLPGFALSILFLAGCNPAPEPQAVQDGTAGQVRETRPAANTGLMGSTSQAGAADATTSLPDTLDLGLQHGVYTAEDGGCPPALATVSTFDGRGFDTRNFGNCRFDPRTRDGRTFSGPQTCTDTYSREKQTETITITVLSPTRFVRSDPVNTSRRYSLCPHENLSDWTG